MFWGPSISSISANMVTLFMTSLLEHWVAKDRVWLTSTGGVILLTWWFHSFIQWMVSSGHWTAILSFSYVVLSPIGSTACLFPGHLHLWFSSLSPFLLFHPWPTIQAICHCLLVFVKTVLTLHGIITTMQAETMRSYLNNQQEILQLLSGLWKYLKDSKNSDDNEYIEKWKENC